MSQVIYKMFLRFDVQNVDANSLHANPVYKESINGPADAPAPNILMG